MNNLENKMVLILGDSIMYGAGNNGKGVGEFLEEICHMKFIKRAINAATIAFWNPEKSWIVDQVREVLRENINPDYIVMDGFTNDCCVLDGTMDTPRTLLGNENPKLIDINDINESNNFSECFISIIQTLRDNYPKAKIVFVRPHNMGRRLDHLQRLYGERAVLLAKKYNLEICDIYNESTLNTFDPIQRKKYTFDRFNDGLGDATHPNELCYREIYMPLIIKHLKNC